MKHFAFLILALAIALAGSGPALAHRPYFTQIEKIRLPNGELGEARLLNGDGIFVPDPVRVLLLDAQGRLLARSSKSQLMTLSCGENRQCAIFDLSNGRMLDPEPSSFRSGDPVPGLRDEDRNELWELEDGSESWGFSSRAPTINERLESYGLLAQERLLIILFDGLTGILCAVIVIALSLIWRMQRTRWFHTAAVALVMLLIMGIGLSLAFISGIVSLVSGLPISLWLISFVTGCMGFYSGYRILRSQRGHAPSGSRANP
jgi:hypothetical protein